MQNFTNVIICGGFGKRLWPLSRENFPKPFISILGNEPLFQQTINRNASCNNYMIITNEQLYYQCKYQIEHLSLSTPYTFILESDSRNTGPAILLAALNANDDEMLVVTPADHHISTINDYKETIDHACKYAGDENIALIGINPSYPATEYGYIETNQTKVISFKEKPNQSLAEEYIKKGNYLWNSGIFCFKAKTLKKVFQSIKPDEFQKIKSAFDNRSNDQIVNLSNINSMSFDQGILENCSNIKVVNAKFDWNDLGNFDEINKSNVQSNITEINASNNSLISTSNKTPVFHNIDDVYVIESNDAILVGKKGQSKNVSEAVAKLKETNTNIIEHSKTVHRPWGFYSILDEKGLYKVKKITVYPNRRLSLQSHKHRNEHWVCVKGTVTIINGEETYTLSENESTYIEKETKHRIHNKSTTIVEIIEVQFGSYLGEDDIERFESDY